jgi:hypothetical protein
MLSASVCVEINERVLILYGSVPCLNISTISYRSSAKFKARKMSITFNTNKTGYRTKMDITFNNGIKQTEYKITNTYFLNMQRLIYQIVVIWFICYLSVSNQNPEQLRICKGRKDCGSVVQNFGFLYDAKSAIEICKSSYITVAPGVKCFDKYPSCKYLKDKFRVCEKTEVVSTLGCNLTCKICGGYITHAVVTLVRANRIHVC